MNDRNAASGDEWLDAYERVYQALPYTAQVSCPNCGLGPLQIAFTGDEKTRVGYASFWCSNCRYGIHLSRVPIPGGVEVIPLGLSRDQRAVYVPNYTLVPID